MSSSNDNPSPPQLRGHMANLRGTPVGRASAPGIVTFVLGRLCDAPLQYLMFSEGWAAKGLAAVGLRASNLLVASGPGVAGLGPIPTLLTSMYAAASIRHVYWVLFTNNHQWPVGPASMVVTYNFLVDTIATFAAVNSLTSAPEHIAGTFTSSLGWKQWVGLGLFVVGLSMEIIAEETRKKFKKDPKNKGKIDDTGLWGIVRHPNYLGYSLWRSGIMLATGSFGATAAFTIWQIANFVTMGIPGLATFMSAKYGEQWSDYTKRVPSTLIPGVY